MQRKSNRYVHIYTYTNIYVLYSFIYQIVEHFCNLIFPHLWCFLFGDLTPQMPSPTEKAHTEADPSRSAA